jgi:hypothetical protein
LLFDIRRSLSEYQNHIPLCAAFWEQVITAFAHFGANFQFEPSRRILHSSELAFRLPDSDLYIDGDLFHERR